MMHELTPDDLSHLAAIGITAAEASTQLARLRSFPPPIHLARPATVGDGIERFQDASAGEATSLIEQGTAAAAAGRVLKFVPASGAATRMFKELVDGSGVTEFLARLDDFPFAHELRQRAGEHALVRTLLDDMAMATLPKGLVPFHRTEDGARARTAFEEQLLEAIGYTRDRAGVCRLHFTVPVEAREAFAAALTAARPLVEAQRPGTRLVVDFSTQSPSTDTLALAEDGTPFRNADGSLLLRPSGHGALLGNLHACGGDIVVVKNIDNVLPDGLTAEVIRWKLLLIGYLVRLQAEVFAHLRAVTGPASSEATLAAARTFAATRFAHALSPTASRADIVDALHRPLRVCGVVRNVGEPGGAPFWVQDASGHVSLQIVEPGQVDLEDAEQMEIFRSATHFNPVDLVCGLRAHDGTTFDLPRYVDADTAFVTRKTAGRRSLIALERPGLWNGSMAGWNTVCVEVPASTFAPVKTVFDLLRPQHQRPAGRP